MSERRKRRKREGERERETVFFRMKLIFNLGKHQPPVFLNNSLTVVLYSL